MPAVSFSKVFCWGFQLTIWRFQLGDFRQVKCLGLQNLRGDDEMSENMFCA